jgi:transposase-like protein
MPAYAAVRSVKQAARILKSMEVQGEEWAGYREASRRAVAGVIEGRMREAVGNRLAELAAAGVADRRNGTYTRQLLTSLGAVDLSVPRTRTFVPTAVLRA